MIAGIFLRYFKTYQGIHYIPITDEDRFCGLVGDNGIGKSSVLEALDCFFNEKTWNFNIATKRSGKSATKPQIVPLFLVEKEQIAADIREKAELLHNIVLSISEDDVSPKVKGYLRRFIEHRNEIACKNDLDNFYLLPIGMDYKGGISVSVFNCRLLVEGVISCDVAADKTSLDSGELEELRPLLEGLKQLVEYIYIPKEMDPELFTKLETAEIQILMGETLTQILSERVTARQIADINTSLISFLNTLSDELEVYSYRTPTDRQQNLKKTDVYNLIIQAFFNIRKLHKKQGDSWLEISSLSSGEKQKAIIDVAHSLLSRHRDSGSNLIIGVDEPESSLHMSACFDQFDALYDISRDCMQVIFSSHWYGFLPTIESGSATIISKVETNHVFDQINLASYREQVKQMTSQSRGRLPYDIRLKSVNDFVQSVITSSIGDNPFNWIICEGSSEKIYLSKYLQDIIDDKRLRVVPVGGAKEVKRLYNHLSTSYEDFKDEISGKIILISDTDSELVNYEVANYDNLICRRIVNCSNAGTTTLVKIQSNPVSPATDIESALNGRLFFETLKTFIQEYQDLLSFLDDITDEIAENSSHFSLDLRASQWASIQTFFNSDNNKFVFAKRYADSINETYETPGWIQEIRGWLE